jgi:uncharacterized protein YaiE (UPF0345 family)
MAIGSGLGSQFGFVAESTYGTFLAPTKFLRARSYAVERTSTRQQGSGISTGQHGQLLSQYVEPINGAQAQVAFDVQNKGLGVLLNTLMGGTVTPAVLTGSAYGASFPLADTLGKSITCQAGAPLRGGTVVPHSLSGGKIIGAEFSCSVDSILSGTLDIDGKVFSSVQSLAVASYTSTGVFHGGQMGFKAGAFGSEAAVSGVRAVSVKIDRPHDTQDYTAGSSGQKAEPVLNDWTSISLQVTADWLAKATFQDLAHSTSSTSIVWEFVGPLITGTHYETFRITLPGVTFDQSTQDVSGRGELTNTWNATWRFDGTNLPTIYTISTDTTL